jgi:hypothetical protein
MKFYLRLLYVLSFFLIGCEDIVIAEYSNIGNFSLVERKADGDTIIEISGLCMMSAYVVKKIEIKETDDILSVKVVLSLLGKKGKSGSFKESIIISQNINKVVFGNSEIILWTSSNDL